MSAHQQFQHFIKETCGRDIVHQGCKCGDRCTCCLVYGKPQFGSEPDDTKHTHRIFPVPLFRITDHSQCFVAKIPDSTVIIKQYLIGGIIVHGIDRKVASGRIFRLGSEIIVAEQSAGFILDGGFVGSSPKRRDFNQILAEHDVNDLKPAANQKGALEKTFDLFGCGVGCDIEIFGLQAKQKVTDGAPDNKGIVAFVL